MIRYKKIGPLKLEDIWFDTEAFLKSGERMVCLHTNNVLKEKEYDAVVVSQTLLLDISIELNDIFNGFESKSCKYCIRRAEKEGVTVKKAENKDELKRYLTFENVFCKERGIPEVSMSDVEKLDIFYALSNEGEYLGGCAFVVSSKEKLVRYKYGATLHKLSANEAILWAAIRFYHEAGMHTFDFGGVVPTDDKDSYYYRHYKFKKKFGGSLKYSYSYFKLRGVIRFAYKCWDIIVQRFFKGNLNEAINFLNRHRMIG